MTLIGKQLTTAQRVISILVVMTAALGCAALLSWNPFPFIGVGVLLLVVSLWISRSPSKGTYYTIQQKGTGMESLEKWDEQQITLAIGRYRGDVNLLSKYIDGLVGRFVMGQDTHTMEVRTKFLQTFNKHAEVARESYKWQRYMQGGRAAQEEDLADLRAKIALQQAQNELAGASIDAELVKLQKQAKRLDVQIEIARSEKAIAELKKPDPPPPPPPQEGPTAEEVHARKKSALQAREKQIREEIAISKEDSSLEEDLKQRKLNGLYEKLTEIHDGLIELL